MQHQTQTKELWGQMHQRLLSYIRARVATLDDAEDILQDVFVRIHANRSDVRNSQSVTAWVYQITRNAITDYYRRRATSAEAFGKLADELDESTALAPDPEAQTNIVRRAADEFATCVEPMLERLPEPYRQALTLTEFDGMTQKAAAERLGLSLSATKSRVGRGRDKLKDVILDCCEVELDGRGGLVDYHRRHPEATDDCNCD